MEKTDVRAGARARIGAALAAAASCLTLAGALAPAASASPYIHAHRGGTLQTVNGEQSPLYPESSLRAYRAAAKRGFVLEMDTRVTADGQVVIMHDAKLDRTTSCDGLVRDRTLAQIQAGCEIDIVGTDTGGQFRQLGPGDERRAPVPTLAQVLALAKRYDAQINLEVNNYPTDPDYDSSGAFGRAVAAVVRSSGLPPEDLIVQSFLPTNLQPFTSDPYFDSAETSFLSFASTNSVAATIAKGAGIDYVSPQWPVSDSFIQEAHSLGLRVVPFTLDTPADVRAATLAGVDALITNDPRMARRVVRSVAPKPPAMPKPPSRATCRGTQAGNLATPIESFDPTGSGPRVFAIQFKQDIANVASYGDFRTKIECLIREYVVPRMADDRPNVVALPEDVAVMTLATGSRAAATRQIFGNPGGAPGCSGQPAPCGVVAALLSLDGAYAPQEAAYGTRFGPSPPFAQTFLAGTDTFARGWMQTFSDIAKRYGVYILGSNNQAEFRESVDPSEIARFADPDVPNPQSAYVATSQQIYNEAFMWGPKDVTQEGPAPLRNVVASNKKVPLTQIEQVLSITPGPSSGPDGIENVAPYRIPETKARMSFATSLPAFIYDGDLSPFGQPPAAGVDPCSDTSRYYMYCLEKLGTNLVMQDEANPGRWANPQGSNWQPLEWMGSTWRAAADPSVSFDYNVTPHMVGNLADLEFDGQTAITQRGLKGPRGMSASCNYVGNSTFMPGAPENDPAGYGVYAGPKREFLGLADWAAPDGPRERLRSVASALAPGSGSRRENDYLETAVIADLTYPPDPRRPNCNTGSVTVAGRCANLHAGSSLGERLAGTRRGDRILGLGGDDSIRAGGGADCAKGGPGRDRIKGGAGRDRIDGGGGADLIDVRGGGRDRVRCGPGDDVALAGRRDRVRRSCEAIRRKRR